MLYDVQRIGMKGVTCNTINLNGFCDIERMVLKGVLSNDINQKILRHINNWIEMSSKQKH